MAIRKSVLLVSALSIALPACTTTGGIPGASQATLAQVINAIECQLYGVVASLGVPSIYRDYAAQLTFEVTSSRTANVGLPTVSVTGPAGVTLAIGPTFGADTERSNKIEYKLATFSLLDLQGLNCAQQPEFAIEMVGGRDFLTETLFVLGPAAGQPSTVGSLTTATLTFEFTLNRNAGVNGTHASGNVGALSGTRKDVHKVVIVFTPNENRSRTVAPAANQRLNEATTNALAPPPIVIQ
jgi:hypothetical protein